MPYKEEILERAIQVAEYIVEQKATVRQAAEKFGISKTTIHDDVTEKLRYVNWKLYYEVRNVLQYNISQRAIRGGKASKKKHKK